MKIGCECGGVTDCEKVDTAVTLGAGVHPTMPVHVKEMKCGCESENVCKVVAGLHRLTD